MRNWVRSKLSRVAVALLLLTVQVAVAGHLDLDDHSQETQCAICASASTLDAANVSQHGLLTPVVFASTQYLESEVLVAARTSGDKHARAPPVAS